MGKWCHERKGAFKIFNGILTGRCQEKQGTNPRFKRYQLFEGRFKMSFLKPVFIALFVISLAGCANTIRGVGQDTANAVDATVDATNNVVRSGN